MEDSEGLGWWQIVTAAAGGAADIYSAFAGSEAKKIAAQAVAEEAAAGRAGVVGGLQLSQQELELAHQSILIDNQARREEEAAGREEIGRLAFDIRVANRRERELRNLQEREAIRQEREIRAAARERELPTWAWVVLGTAGIGATIGIVAMVAKRMD
jgi:hypothetical protein